MKVCLCAAAFVHRRLDGVFKRQSFEMKIVRIICAFILISASLRQTLSKVSLTMLPPESSDDAEDKFRKPVGRAAFAELPCALCDAKQDLEQAIDRKNLADIKARGMITFAYAKVTNAIPSCKVCTKDYFHHVLLKWRGREDLLLEHSCEETECDKYVKNSWLVAPSGNLPLRHTTIDPFSSQTQVSTQVLQGETSYDEVDKENKK